RTANRCRELACRPDVRGARARDRTASGTADTAPSGDVSAARVIAKLGSGETVQQVAFDATGTHLAYALEQDKANEGKSEQLWVDGIMRASRIGDQPLVDERRRTPARVPQASAERGQAHRRSNRRGKLIRFEGPSTQAVTLIVDGAERTFGSVSYLVFS